MAKETAEYAHPDLVGGGLTSLHLHAGAVLTISEVEVFNGTSPAPSAWTDLDLRGTVGSNAALVLLKFFNASSGTESCHFRRNGDVDESYKALPYGHAAGGDIGAGKYTRYWLETDDGIVEWQYESAGEANTTIDLLAYIK